MNYTLSNAEAIRLCQELMPLYGPSTKETAVADFIRQTLYSVGLAESSIYEDRAHTKSVFGGDCGNLIVNLAGTVPLPRRLLSAHMDTVTIHIGADPVVVGDRIISRSTAGTGSDNRSGVAIVLHTALRLLREGIPHPPLTLLFTVQEESGTQGALYAEFRHFGEVEFAICWDGREPERISTANQGKLRMEIVLETVPTKGNGPLPGVLQRAMSQLINEGWLGSVKKGTRTGSSSINVIQTRPKDFPFETNVCMDQLCIHAAAGEKGDATGFDLDIAAAFQTAFEKAAAHAAAGTKVDVSFQILAASGGDGAEVAVDAPVVRLTRTALANVGLKAWYHRVGNDAGRLRSKGLDAVQLGTGDVDAHSPDNHLYIPDFLLACEAAVQIASQPVPPLEATATE